MRLLLIPTKVIVMLQFSMYQRPSMANYSASSSSTVPPFPIRRTQGLPALSSLSLFAPAKLTRITRRSTYTTTQMKALFTSLTSRLFNAWLDAFVTVADGLSSTGVVHSLALSSTLTKMMMRIGIGIWPSSSTSSLLPIPPSAPF